jgi:hypothetical protein
MVQTPILDHEPSADNAWTRGGTPFFRYDLIVLVISFFLFAQAIYIGTGLR